MLKKPFFYKENWTNKRFWKLQREFVCDMHRLLFPFIFIQKEKKGGGGGRKKEKTCFPFLVKNSTKKI